MLRSILLYLSHAGWAKSVITNFPLAKRVARRFVAGETLAEAVSTIRQLNQEGLLATLDFLGESVHSKTDAEAAAAEYVTMLDAIAEHQLDATVSLKLTQLGLDLSESVCLNNMRTIVSHAATTRNHVTIDMESTGYTDVTLRIFRTLMSEYPDHIGTVIQAYLYRSEDDMAALRNEGAFVRLCKGAYMEPPKKAFPDKADVDANFVKLMQHYISNNAAETGAYLGIASHDVSIIDEARRYSAQHAIGNDRFEFQMLYGIRSDLQRELAAEGYKMRVYVPFGTQWYPYFMRRLAERPANLWFFISNFFRK